MAGLLNTSCLLMCPHGGTVTVVSANTRTKAAGDFILRSSDTFIVAGSGIAHHFELHLDFQSKLVDASNNDAPLLQFD